MLIRAPPDGTAADSQVVRQAAHAVITSAPSFGGQLHPLSRTEIQNAHLAEGYMSNSIQATAGNVTGPGETGLRATKAVCRDRGVSDTTFWRWGKRGWVKLVNICGKSYVDLKSLAEFDQRAAAGEFAKGP